MESKQEIDAIMQEANFEDPEQTRGFLDEHEFENQQEIQEYLTEHTQDGALEYLVRGALLACRLGTIPNKLNLPRCHGVYITTHPVVHWRNSEPLKNIPPFGICSVTQEPCKPDIVGFWRDTYSETRIVDNGDINFGDRQTAKNLDSNPDGPKPKGEDSITTISFLICAKGGLIEPLKSGQEQTNDPEEQEYANDHADPEECGQCADDKKPMHEKNKVQENKGDVHGDAFDQKNEQESAQTDYTSDSRYISLQERVATFNIEQYKKDFVLEVFPELLKYESKTGIPAEIMFGQICTESAYGSNTLVDYKTGVNGNNYFGYKGEGPAGSVECYTYEYINGQRVKIVDKFKAYHSREESIEDYTNLLLKNYKQYAADDSPEAWAKALVDGGYATAPNYGENILDISRTWRIYDE